MKAQKPITGRLRKRGKFFHAILYPYVNGHRTEVSRTTGKTNRRDAEAILKKLKREYDEHGLEAMLSLMDRQEASSILLSNYMLTTWLAAKKHTLRPSTRRNYERMITGRIRDFFDSKKTTISGATAALLEDFFDSLAAENLAANTRRQYYIVFNQALSYAVRHGVLDRNPLEPSLRPRVRKTSINPYTVKEAMKLLDGCKDDPLYIVILIALFYGLRRNEILGTQLSDIDFDANVIHFKHKLEEDKENKKTPYFISDISKTDSYERTEPLIPFVKEELLQHLDKQKQYREILGPSYSQDWLNSLCVRPDGQILKPNYVSTHFPRLLKCIGLRRIRFHDLRHTCATLLVANKTPLKHVQKWLGHSSITITANTYSHLSTTDLNTPAQCIEGLLSSPTQTEEFPPE